MDKTNVSSCDDLGPTESAGTSGLCRDTIAGERKGSQEPTKQAQLCVSYLGVIVNARETYTQAEEQFRRE